MADRSALGREPRLRRGLRLGRQRARARIAAAGVRAEGRVHVSREETAQASKEKFGAELAFHDINTYGPPDIDLIVVGA